MKLFWIFSIDQNVVQIHYNEDIKLFSKNFVDIVLKIGGCIGKVKGYYLVLEVVVSSAKSRLLFVTFLNLHLMIGTSQVQPGKLLGSAQTI